MLTTRVLPCLLIKEGGLVKTTKFKKPSYVGDPINAVKIFNKKEVDELVVLDIEASQQGRGPDYDMIRDFVSEAFMPLAYGGGITTLEQARELLSIGVEKIVVNTALETHPDLISELAEVFGAQAVVAAMDVKKGLLKGYDAYSLNGSKALKRNIVEFAKELEAKGAGEIFLTAIDRDGTMAGYDLKLISEIADAVDIPVVANGGASSVEDFEKAVKAGASAVAAGAMFVYHGPHRAVLISYPERKILEGLLP
ncbi:MAG: imidazole glycerol phosphate synthase subunit HisF [Methylocystaceae bacterium]|nr:imidazole glycerol phosphate synthase subunit HisF [Methylocystaceae bacterium]